MTSLSIYAISATVCFLTPLVLRLLQILYVRKPTIAPEGCRQLGLGHGSDLADEHDSRYSISKQTDADTSWKVKSLWIYPVKSCRGVELDHGTISGKGMDYDRQFSFAQLTSETPASVDETGKENEDRTWSFITLRTFPLMANIEPEIWIPDSSDSTYSDDHQNVKSQGVIVLKFPSVTKGKGFWGTLSTLSRLLNGGNTDKIVHLPFNPTQDPIRENGYVLEDMKIWKDKPTSLLMASTEDADSDSWIHELRRYLGVKNHLALFRVSSVTPREVYRCAPRKDELGYQPTVGFQDAYPLHMLNLASVHDVAKNMEPGATPIGARNFRPNIVITGGSAYTEDTWKRIRIGGYEYYVACRTVRCLLPNVNPATGVQHASEPNRTLKSMRKVDPGDTKNACLGMQMVPAKEYSEMRVGETITVLETGEHYYLKQ